MKNEQKIIIAGGGTGGHIFPAIAVARALLRKNLDTKILFVGAKGKMEMRKVPEAGFKIVGLDIAGMNRSSLFKNIGLPFKILHSLSQSKKILRDFKPDVALGVGGYASFPLLYTAQRKGIPTVIQEQNSYAGKANKLLGKKARKICVGSKNMERFFEKEKIVFTGNPVRENIVNLKRNQTEALSSFGLKEEKKTVFIVGGSQGAKAINEALLAHIGRLFESRIQLIWQTGKASFEKVAKAVTPYKESIKPFAFLKNIEQAYAAADVIISRAGAIALAELAIVGKPVIFVPFPAAAEDHQLKNARYFVKEKAALLVENKDAENQLVNTLEQLIKDNERQKEMRENIKKLAVTDADERIADEILKLVKK